MSEISPVPAEPTEPTGETPKPRKRRGWLIALLVVAVLVVLGIVAFLIVDGIAKDYARDYVRARIVAVLGLPEDATVDVDLGGGSIILQALAGRIETVDVSVPDVAFGDLAGSVALHAEGVPLDESASVETLRIDFAVGESDIEVIAGSLSGLNLDSIELAEPDIVVATSFSVFGVPIPIGMTLEPSANEGHLAFTPTSITVGEATFGTQQLLDNPLFGSFARDLLRQQSVCIAGNLPQALVLTDATVDGDALVLSISGDGAALGGPELATLGSC